MNPLRSVRTAVFLIAVLFGAEQSLAQASGPSQAAPAPVTLQEFRTLGWLAGDWRGESAGEAPFFESYRFADDSTLVMTYYSDSTRTRVTASGTVELRGGQIVHRSGQALWVVTHFSPSELRFAPRERARNSFIWKQESRSEWTASLSYPNRAPIIYRLKRLAAKGPA